MNGVLQKTWSEGSASHKNTAVTSAERRRRAGDTRQWERESKVTSELWETSCQRTAVQTHQHTVTHIRTAVHLSPVIQDPGNRCLLFIFSMLMLWRLHSSHHKLESTITSVWISVLKSNCILNIWKAFKTFQKESFWLWLSNKQTVKRLTGQKKRVSQPLTEKKRDFTGVRVWILKCFCFKFKQKVNFSFMSWE